MQKGRKTWLTAVLAAVAAAAAVVVPQAAPAVEVALSIVGQLLIGTETAPAVVLPGAEPPADPAARPSGS